MPDKTGNWSDLPDETLIKSTGFLEDNPFRPACTVGDETVTRLGRILRDRLLQYEEQQEVSRRVSKERHMAEKKKSDRVKRDVEENRVRNEQRREMNTRQPGLKKVLPKDHAAFYATRSQPSPKFKQPDRKVYGVTMADGVSYKYLDDKEQTRLTCSALRPDSASPGRDSYKIGKELRNLSLGDSVYFLQHPKGDGEMFRLWRQDSSGSPPPPGHYYLGHGEDNFHRYSSSSYVRRPGSESVAGRRGLPKMGKDPRVVIGASDGASWVNLRETSHVPPPGRYFRKDDKVKNASYALQFREPDPSHKPVAMAEGFTIGETNRGILPSTDDEATRLKERHQALAEFCHYGHWSSRNPHPRYPDSPAARDPAYQQTLTDRLRVHAEQRWKPTPKEPYARPPSPLPATSFFRVDQSRLEA